MRNTGTGLVMSVISILIGVILSTTSMYWWYIAQNEITIYVAEDISFLTLQFYSIQFISLILITLGIIFFIRYLIRIKWDFGSIIWTVSTILGNKRNIKYGIYGGVLYFLIYILLSGFLVLRPWINYREILGVERFTVFFTGCCGEFGTVPRITVYILPDYGLGVLLTPLNLLLSITLALLIGINIAIAYHSIKISRVNSPNLLAKIGLITGAFTGCPTCTAVVISSLTGVVGSGILAILVTYQLALIMITIVILIISPFVNAYLLSRNIYCRIGSN